MPESTITVYDTSPEVPGLDQFEACRPWLVATDAHFTQRATSWTNRTEKRRADFDPGKLGR